VELSRIEDTFLKIDDHCETVNPRQVKVSVSKPIEYPERTEGVTTASGANR